MITYTWKIEQLDASPIDGELTNVVRKIHWRMAATDGVNTTDAYGDTPLSAADPEVFTAYPELSQSTVIAWLEAAIDARAGEGELTVAQMRTNMARMLAAMAAPAIVPLPVPWE